MVARVEAERFGFRTTPDPPCCGRNAHGPERATCAHPSGGRLWRVCFICSVGRICSSEFVELTAQFRLCSFEEVSVDRNITAASSHWLSLRHCIETLQRSLDHTAAGRNGSRPNGGGARRPPRPHGDLANIKACSSLRISAPVRYFTSMLTRSFRRRSAGWHPSR